MKTRNAFTVRWLVLVLVISLVMAACAPVPAPAGGGETAAPAAEESVDIAVSYMASGTYDKAAEDLAAEFQEKGMNVSVAAFPWATLRQNNTNDLLTDAGQYDVMSGAYYLADVFQYFAPLDEYIERDNYGEGLIPGLLEPGKSDWLQGSHIGVPYGIDAYGLLYRTDLFEEAGIDPAFASWDDLVAALDQLQSSLGDDISPFVFAFGAGEQIPAFFFSSYDGTYINADGNYELETEKAVAAIDVATKLLPYAPENAMALSIDEANAVFLDGKAATLIGWPSFVRTPADDPDQSKVVGMWAQTEFPGAGFPWLSLWQLYMPATTENPDEAWEWMKEYTSEANAGRWLEEYGIGSIYTSTYEDPAVLEMHGHDFPAALANFERALNPPLSGEAQDFLAATMGEVLLGNLDAAAAVDQINATWSTIPVPEALLEAAQGAGLAQ